MSTAMVEPHILREYAPAVGFAKFSAALGE
jgi:hypothetical protein